MSRFNF